MTDIDKIFAESVHKAIEELELTKASKELADRKEQAEREKRSNSDQQLISEIYEGKKKLETMLESIFEEPSEFSLFIDRLIRSPAIDMYSHLFDISPIRYIGELPRRRNTDKTLINVVGEGAEVYDIPNFKASYSLVNLATFRRGEPDHEFSLTLAVAQDTHLKDRNKFEIDIPKYEVVCYRVGRWSDGSLHTELLDFSRPVPELRWALHTFATFKSEFFKVIVLNHPHFLPDVK